MNKYFENIGTLEELRKQYKELLKLHHPDNGGNIGTMQEINAEYDRLFKLLKDKHDSSHAGNNDNSRTAYDNMKYDFTEDVKLREIINKIISFDGITIEITSSWIWVSGSTYQHKKELKGTGFKWASQKKDVVLAL